MLVAVVPVVRDLELPVIDVGRRMRRKGGEERTLGMRPKISELGHRLSLAISASSTSSELRHCSSCRNATTILPRKA